MEKKTVPDNFQLTVSMTVVCSVLWWAAGSFVSGAFGTAMGGAGLTEKTAAALPASYAVSIKTSFALHGVNNGLVELCTAAGTFSPAAGKWMYLFVYFGLGACGIFVLAKHRREILAELRAEPQRFIPAGHRARRFLSNPLVLIFLICMAGLLAQPFLRA